MTLLTTEQLEKAASDLRVMIGAGIKKPTKQHFKECCDYIDANFNADQLKQFNEYTTKLMIERCQKYGITCTVTGPED